MLKMPIRRISPRFLGVCFFCLVEVHLIIWVKLFMIPILDLVWAFIIRRIHRREELATSHLSHFREGWEINNKWTKNKKDIPIRELFFDLNYFNCYYKNMINNIDGY